MRPCSNTSRATGGGTEGARRAPPPGAGAVAANASGLDANTSSLNPGSPGAGGQGQTQSEEAGGGGAEGGEERRGMLVKIGEDAWADDRAHDVGVAISVEIVTMRERALRAASPSPASCQLS